MCGARTHTGISFALSGISALHQRDMHVGRAAMSLHFANSETTLSCVPMHPPPHERARHVNTFRDILQKAWSLRVVWDCMTNQPNCTRKCCTSITKIMGYVLVREPSGNGLAFVGPCALTATWQPRLGPTLLSLDSAYKGYLGY